MVEFVTLSELYTSVGGDAQSTVQGSEDGQLLVDDIGRHNCLDKITGRLLMEDKLGLAADGVVFVSGRLPSEMLMKLVRLGIPVAVSKSSPTIAAIRLAREWGITVLGYVKDGGGIIYSCPERITDENAGRSG
jgi:FdhD protein